MSKIYFLPVKHGDAFIIECVRGDTQGLVVVDGGPRSCGFELKRKLNELGTPDLMVLTHYDEDHIGGILQLVDTCLDDNMIPAKEVWANCAGYVEVAASKYTTAAHGMLLSVRLNELAKQHGMVWRNDLHEGMEFDRPFASIEVVSPTEDVTKMVIEKQKDEARQLLNATQKDTIDLEKPLDKLAKEIPPEPNLKKDNELANAASIAFILRCDNLSILMLGDSYPQNVERYLREEKGYSEENPLVVDFVKVSHHGSRNNTSNSLLDIIQCDKFIISTNGSNGSSNHPDRTTIAHILCHTKRNMDTKVHLYFNYKLELIETNGIPFLNEGECEKWNFEVHDNIKEL